MVRSFEKIHETDLGINPVGLFKVQLTFPADAVPDAEARLLMFDRLRARLVTLPGVKGVTYGEDTVLTGGFWGREQVRKDDGTYLATTGSFVAADFYRVAGLTMLRGRWFSEDRSQNEVVVSETMAKALYGNRDPLEMTFKLKAYPKLTYRVVGVARDVRESVRSPSGMRFYAPCWWYPPLISTLVLRLDREPGPEFAGLVRHAIYEFDPRLLAYNVTSFSDEIENSLWSELFAYKVLKVLAGIALGLAMVGMFSTVTYTVHCKRREFGIRLALGALPKDLHQLVIWRSLAVAAFGVAVGVSGGLVLTRFMQSLLFETAPSDPSVYLLVAVLLLVMAAIAAWLPARRAAKVDPVIALRAE
jgi:putative ABC transport system permease protein